MITIHIKQMNGEIFSLEFDPSKSADELYRAVWRSLTEEMRPIEKWRMMLMRAVEEKAEKDDGEWIRPIIEPIPLDHDEILLLWIESGQYTIQRIANGWSRGGRFYHHIISVEDLIHQNEQRIDLFTDHLSPSTFYFQEEVDLKEDAPHPEFYDHPHTDLMVLLQRMNLSPCIREWFYYQIYQGIVTADIKIIQLCHPDCPFYDLDDLQMEDDLFCDEDLIHPNQIEDGQDAVWEAYRQESRFNF